MKPLILAVCLGTRLQSLVSDRPKLMAGAHAQVDAGEVKKVQVVHRWVKEKPKKHKIRALFTATSTRRGSIIPAPRLVKTTGSTMITRR